AVVRQPRVTKTSLWAMGMPVSGAARPSARAASAARAWASVRSASTCRKAFSSWRAAMASSALCASSVAETRRSSKALRSSAMLANSVCRGNVMGLLDDLGHQEKAVLDGGGVGQKRVARCLRGRFGDLVLAQAQGHVLDGGDGVGERFHALGVHGLQLFDQAEDAVEVFEDSLLDVACELQPGQPRDARDVVFGKRHGRCDGKAAKVQKVTFLRASAGVVVTPLRSSQTRD